MAITDVGIINAALGNIGHTIFIASRSEVSNEADVANVYYDNAVLYVLEDFAWDCARAYVTLALVEEEPNFDWLFSYRYPANCAMVRRLVRETLGRKDPAPPEFVIGQDSQGKVVYTDEENAVAEITEIIEDPSKFSAKMGEAISWWLGFKMCPGLAKDRKIALLCESMYHKTVRDAEAKAANQSQQGPELESEAVRARE